MSDADGKQTIVTMKSLQWRRFFAILVFITVFQVSSGIKLPFRDVTSCSKGTQYFQHSSLECVTCGTHKIPSSDSITCSCDSGYKLTKYYGGPEVNCAKCGFNEAVTADGWNCIRCANDGFDRTTKTCRPCLKGVNVDRYQDGSFYNNRTQSCLTCVEDTGPLSNERVCKRCHQNVLELTSSSRSGISCTCPQNIVRKSDGVIIKTEETDGICFRSEDLITEPIFLSSLPTGESAFVAQHLRAAQAMCSKYSNYTACQLLGNMCVMNMYNEDNFRNARTDACKEYLSIVSKYRKDFVQNLKDWPSTMPWLYYKSESATVTLDKTDISYVFSRRESLRFVVVSYHANGTFISVSEDATVLQMCPQSQHVTSNAFLFTTPYLSSCKLKVADLRDKHETVFYDLYLRVGNELYPVPVLVENYNSANTQSNRANWKLTRRFFLVDNLSGVPLANPDATNIWYAETFEILIRLRNDGLIYPPLLKVRYDMKSLTKSQKITEEVAVSFKVSYEMDTDKIHEDIKIATAVLSVLAIVYASIRIFSYRKRGAVQVIDCSSIMIFLLYCCSALAFVFLMLLIGISIKWLFFVKQQTTVIRILPTPNQEQLMKSLFVAAFIMKAVYIVYVLYAQIDVDIFFIDWEKPHTVGKHHEEEAKPPSVSIMRTLFVANEWRELQTTRKINPTLLLIILILFLKAIGFENWTTTDPIYRLSIDSTTDYIGGVSFTLRFAVISLLYLVIAVVLWILFSFFYERFVSDSIGDFIDFCSMSNISVFVLSHSHFGYYIHGLSVHGRADTSMHELYEHFQREEDNLCGTRGLEPNNDRQTFEVAVSRKFRIDYERILNVIINPSVQGMRRDAASAQQNKNLGRSTLSPSLENSVSAYHTMNKYLSSFIEHSIRDNNYVIKDKAFSEKILQNEVIAPQEQSSILYNDDNRSFTSIFLCGQEWSLLIFNLLLFLMIDWISNWNSVLALVVAYFVDVIIVTIRDHFGTRNLSRKTMVDERFLI